MCGKLSSIKRLTAMVRRSIEADGLLDVRQAGVVGMERQRDEGLEPAGLVLQFAEPHQVVDAVVGVFDVAVEHRGVGAQAQLVGRAVDIQPLVASALCSQIWSRTSGWKISAPPPGRLPRPASIRSSGRLATGLPAEWANQSISTAVQAFRCSRG